jgi:hypothetical protein
MCATACCFVPRTLRSPPKMFRVMQAALKQQVFISHTGQDADAKTFSASILKPALERAGLKVYMDFSNLKPGDRWKADLVDAAANSQVVVVVLSKTYTSRFWCMLELDLALNGRPTGAPNKPVIIPVLYHEWAVVLAGPPEASRSTGTPEASIAAAWRSQALLPLLKDGMLEWRTCVDPQRWAANVMSTPGIQHPRATDFRGKPAELEMARGVVGEARKIVAPDVDVSHMVGLRGPSDELLTALATAQLGLWIYGLGKCPASCVHAHHVPRRRFHVQVGSARPPWRRTCTGAWQAMPPTTSLPTVAPSSTPSWSTSTSTMLT